MFELYQQWGYWVWIFIMLCGEALLRRPDVEALVADTIGEGYGLIRQLEARDHIAVDVPPAGIGAAAQSHIGDLLEMHEKNMLSTKDIQRRKKLADDAFARRFEEVMEKHNSANYVS